MKSIGKGISWSVWTIIKYLKASILIVGVSFLVVIGLWKIWDNNLNKINSEVNGAPPSQTLEEIWTNISKVTDVTDRVPPIMMWAEIPSLLSVNAFTTGQGIYFTFAADKVLNEDEKALIMGHEIAHVILHHTDNAYQMFVDNYSNEDELMADNLGAVWAHKAGYDVCRGRETFKKFYEWGGNSLNGSHPPNLYRYDNLAHYCRGAK
jgi:Peptidase family M48